MGAPSKPAFGMPCNGCGLCCQMEVCAVGVAALGNVPAPCPGLRFDGARFRCMVIETADEHSPMASLLMRARLGIDLGCDSEIEAEDR